MTIHKSTELRERIAILNKLIKTSLQQMLDAQEGMRFYILKRDALQEEMDNEFEMAVNKCKLYEIIQSMKGL